MFAASAAGLTAAAACLRIAFYLNRYTFKPYWQWENARILGGVPIPAGLVSPQVLLSNTAVLLGTFGLAALLFRLLRRADTWFDRLARRRTRTLAIGSVPLLLGLAFLSWRQEPHPPPGSPNIILISIDTLRPDHLSCYYPRNTSPHIDALGRQGIVFERAIAQANWTLPSHMSIMTSQVPAAHGVRNSAQRLSGFKVTLAEILKDRGYTTAAFTGGYNVDARFGFDQGFDVYFGDEIAYLALDEKRRFGKGVRLERLIPSAVSWLERNGSRPFFLFLHSWDTHAPYIPHDSLIREFSPHYAGRIHVLTHGLVRKLNDIPQRATSEDRARIRALYDNEIRFVDKSIGVLRQRLGELGILERTIIVFTSDHGDEILEHGCGHGHTLYDPEIHVPLIISYPGTIPAGRRVAGLVRSIDIAPTLLDLAGIEPSHNVRAELQGVSLATYWRGGGGRLVAVSEGRAASLLALRTEHYKYIAGGGTTNSAAEELYDLEQDPEETRNLAGELPERTRRMRAMLGRRLTQLTKVRRSGVSDRMRPDPALQEKLRALGYDP